MPNIVSWDRSGFAKLSNALCLHSAIGWKAKILKGTEKNQVIQTNFWKMQNTSITLVSVVNKFGICLS